MTCKTCLYSKYYIANCNTCGNVPVIYCIIAKHWFVASCNIKDCIYIGDIIND